MSTEPPSDTAARWIVVVTQRIIIWISGWQKVIFTCDVSSDTRLHVLMFSLAVKLPLTTRIIFHSSAPTCILLFFYLLFTRFWLISVLYSIWWFFDYDTPAHGGRRVSFLCDLKVWEYMRDYFPIKVSNSFVRRLPRHLPPSSLKTNRPTIIPTYLATHWHTFFPLFYLYFTFVCFFFNRCEHISKWSSHWVHV